MRFWRFFSSALLGWMIATSVTIEAHRADQSQESIGQEKDMGSPTTELATFGGGCFWCIEAVFEGQEGVKSVTSGYAGGTKENPTYEEVCTGRTGHAEVVQIEYDPRTISYEELLDIFWKAHNPTTPNRQGADNGTQYRSIILYHNDAQKERALRSKDQASQMFSDPIVTEVVPLGEFYRAEEYHQDYYAKNPYAGYCTVVIRPKLRKMGLE
jgi:peptide-methionine (S)-S-oxide reductase